MRQLGMERGNSSRDKNCREICHSVFDALSRAGRTEEGEMESQLFSRRLA